MVYHDLAQHLDDLLSRDIKVEFYRELFMVKIIHQIEGPEASTAEQCIVHKSMDQL